MPWTPQTVIRHRASFMMFPLILLAPTVRSTNLIGTSVTRRPFRTVLSVRSTWKQ